MTSPLFPGRQRTGWNFLWISASPKIVPSSPIQVAALRVPTLLFHGIEDDYVPVRLSDQLAARHPDLIELHRVEGAYHTQSWNADPAAYEAALAAFLARVLSAPPASR